MMDPIQQKIDGQGLLCLRKNTESQDYLSHGGSEGVLGRHGVTQAAGAYQVTPESTLTRTSLPADGWIQHNRSR